MWGFNNTDLQSNIAIDDEGVCTGYLKYIADYTSAGFDMDDGHNFVAFEYIPVYEGSTVSYAFNSKTGTLDSDNILVLQMTEAKKSLSVVFTETKQGEDEQTVTVKLSGLTLEAQ